MVRLIELVHDLVLHLHEHLSLNRQLRAQSRACDPILTGLGHTESSRADPGSHPRPHTSLQLVVPVVFLIEPLDHGGQPF